MMIIMMMLMMMVIMRMIMMRMIMTRIKTMMMMIFSHSRDAFGCLSVKMRLDK